MKTFGIEMFSTIFPTLFRHLIPPHVYLLRNLDIYYVTLTDSYWWTSSHLVARWLFYFLLCRLSQSRSLLIEWLARSLARSLARALTIALRASKQGARSHFALLSSTCEQVYLLCYTVLPRAN